MTSRAPELSREEASGAPASGRAKRIAGAVLPLLVLGALLVSGLPLCPLHTMVGIPCPGCGLTRATLAALHGDFTGALHFHPLVFLLTPTVMFLLLRSTLVHARVLRHDQWQVRTPRWLPLVFGVLLLGVWIARLAGFLGGPPDPIDPSHSLLGRALGAIGSVL